MNSSTFTPCQICESQSTSKYCSNPCELGKENLIYAAKELEGLKQSEDRRVFFYDHSMGDLCDMYTINLLKYAHEKNMKKQQLFAKNADKLLRSIITKINRRFITKELLQSYVNLIRDLYKVNAKMWNYRTWAMHPRYEQADKEGWAINYLEADEIRVHIKQEIDMFADGISYAEKNYE